MALLSKFAKQDSKLLLSLINDKGAYYVTAAKIYILLSVLTPTMINDYLKDDERKNIVDNSISNLYKSKIEKPFYLVNEDGYSYILDLMVLSDDWSDLQHHKKLVYMIIRNITNLAPITPSILNYHHILRSEKDVFNNIPKYLNVKVVLAEDTNSYVVSTKQGLKERIYEVIMHNKDTDSLPTLKVCSDVVS